MIRRLAILLAVLALAVTACGDDDSATTTAAPGTGGAGGDGDATIVIQDFSFSGPDTVAAGTTVVVENQGGVTHTWTNVAGAFDSGNIAPGSSFQLTLDEPGDYLFVCTIHPEMSGSVTVTG